MRLHRPRGPPEFADSVSIAAEIEAPADMKSLSSLREAHPNFPAMFSSILIANRGEISRRIMRTARKLGMRTVAVYSDADTEAAFVREADEAVWIGAAAAADSYLKGDRIIEAALDTGAEAIHPGYGFLSENAGFAEAVGKGGSHLDRPAARSYPRDGSQGRRQGADGKARRARDARLSWRRPEREDAEGRREEASAIRFLSRPSPAAAGGACAASTREADFDAALTSAQREAKASFGDDRVLVEKFIESPRHIEVQVFGDNHDNYIHLFERDCSLQRRRQKVIEEAPAPGMSIRSARR